MSRVPAQNPRWVWPAAPVKDISPSQNHKKLQSCSRRVAHRRQNRMMQRRQAELRMGIRRPTSRAYNSPVNLFSVSRKGIGLQINEVEWHSCSMGHTQILLTHVSRTHAWNRAFHGILLVPVHNSSRSCLFDTRDTYTASQTTWKSSISSTCHTCKVPTCTCMYYPYKG